MRRAGTRQNGDVPGVTPFLVNEETHSTTFGFSGLGCSVHPKNREVVRRRYSVVRDRRSEPCFGQTNDVTVSDVPLETNPGSKIVHLIIQGLDIGEQNTRQGGTVSPFPQPVTNSSTFPAVFPSPPGIIEAAFVSFGAPKNLQWPRWICV